MAAVMKLTDPTRIKILEALLKKRSVVPNIHQIKKYTGFHKATIKSSLDFMVQENLLTGFGPKLNFRKLGYNLDVMAMLQVDMNKKDLFDKLTDRIKKDPHIYRFSSVIGAGNWNLVSRHLYKDIESYYNHTSKNYYSDLEGIYDLIKDRMIFYSTEPHYKNDSRTDSIIKIIKRERGLE